MAIGFAIANGIYKYGSTDKYDKKIAGIVAEEAHWLYLAAVVFGRLFAIINMIPMVWKDRVMTMKSGTRQLSSPQASNHSGTAGTLRLPMETHPS